MFYGDRKCLVKGIYSNTRRQGEILEHVRSMLGPQINAVCINKNVVCGRHRDRKIAALRLFASWAELLLEELYVSKMADALKKNMFGTDLSMVQL